MNKMLGKLFYCLDGYLGKCVEVSENGRWMRLEMISKPFQGKLHWMPVRLMKAKQGNHSIKELK